MDTSRSSTAGTSSATKKVVVVWVEFTAFQKAGPKPGDSDVQPNVWGVPSNRARNGALMQATVTPADAADFGVAFDFKRTREHVVWVKALGRWDKLKGFDVPAGTDDDTTNIDEDLTPENGHIYVIDNPGSVKDNPPAGVEAFAGKFSFIEWVNITVDGNTVKGSDDYPWHCKIWADNVAGAWQRNNTKITNDIDPGPTTVTHYWSPPYW